MTREALKVEDLVRMLGTEETRLEAASTILGREVKLGDLAVTQHFIGTQSREEIFARLVGQRASENSPRRF